MACLSKVDVGTSRRPLLLPFEKETSGQGRRQDGKGKGGAFGEPSLETAPLFLFLAKNKISADCCWVSFMPDKWRSGLFV